MAIDGTVLAASTSCEFNLEQDTIAVRAPKQGRWRKYIPGEIGWNGSAEFLCRDWETEKQIVNCIKTGKTLHVSFHDPEGDLRYYGRVIVTRNGLSAKVGSLIRVPLAFVGTGELMEAEKLSTPTQVLSNKDLQAVNTTLLSTGRCVEIVETGILKYRTLVYDLPAGYQYAFYMLEPLTMVMYRHAYSVVSPYINSCMVKDSEEAADGPNTWLVKNSVIRYQANWTIPYFSPSVVPGTALTLLVKGDALNPKNDPLIYIERLPVE